MWVICYNNACGGTRGGNGTEDQEEVREGAGTDFYGADRTTDPQHFRKLRSRKKNIAQIAFAKKKVIRRQ